MILDTFMYLDYKEAVEGTSLKEIIDDLALHPDYGGIYCVKGSSGK